MEMSNNNNNCNNINNNNNNNMNTSMIESGSTIISRSNSRTSSNSELEKEIADLDITTSTTTTTPSSSTTTTSSATGINKNLNNVIKKRISSSRTPTRKARRIRFYRNGDRFYSGIVIPVSNERYRSFDSLAEDLTRLLEDRICGAVRHIYTLSGKKIISIDELEDGKHYVCLCNNENFKKIEYNPHSINTLKTTINNNNNNNTNTNNIKDNNNSNQISRLSNRQILRPLSPLKTNFNNNINSSSTNYNNSNNTNGLCSNGLSSLNHSPITFTLAERDSVVYPRIVTLIRNGTKPRKIMRLLLNKRNSPSYDHVLTAITQRVKLDTGCVRKVFTLSGQPVLMLADFFANEDVFFSYGNERIGGPDDFKLEPDELKAVNQTRKALRNGTLCNGPKPCMPIKNSVNLHDKTYEHIEMVSSSTSKGKLTTASETITAAAAPPPAQPVLSASSSSSINNLAADSSNGIDPNDLPTIIKSNYSLGAIIGDGNFAIVLKLTHKKTGKNYALKIIDKSKCKGKEHYIDAEVRVMKKLNHPHIMALYLDVDTMANMFLILEYVSGGDLFDAITRVTRFSESQARIMIRHLAAAMAYLHSMSIVHRDIKPENLLVELDGNGTVTELKLADFGLACEVLEPLITVCGTPTYVAPEILMESGYGLKIDVWAAGIILYILLCGFPPFVSPENQQEPLFDAILSGIYEFPEPYWNDIGDGVRDLISNMLQSDPDVRFSSEDVLDHYWTLNEEEEECCSDDVDDDDDDNDDITNQIFMNRNGIINNNHNHRNGNNNDEYDDDDDDDNEDNENNFS